MDWFPDDITEAQTVCALRFDGYRYQEHYATQHRMSVDEVFHYLIDLILESMVLHQDDHDNFATFFALQRFLFKWGGEDLAKSSKEHIAFDFLFLHLYTLDTPEGFSYREYHDRWNEEFKATAEETAAFVRRSFNRNGPRFRD